MSVGKKLLGGTVGQIVGVEGLCSPVHMLGFVILHKYEYGDRIELIEPLKYLNIRSYSVVKLKPSKRPCPHLQRYGGWMISIIWWMISICFV